MFIHRELAMDLATVWDALRSSSTWGEFRTQVSQERFDEILDLFGEYDGEVGEGVPRDDEPFPGTDIPSINDGDYPEWPAQQMLQWIPRHILDSDYSEVQTSALNGDFLVLDPAREAEVVAAFQSAGFLTTRDEELVLRAAGQLSPSTSPRPIPEVIRALASSNRDVRSSAIRMLEEIGIPAVAVLEASLRDMDARIRSGAATALRKIQPMSSETVRALVEALDDESEYVIQAVCYTLASAGPTASPAVPVLIRLLGRDSSKVKDGAGWALGHIGPSAADALPALMEMLQHPNSSLRHRASWALGKIDPSA